MIIPVKCFTCGKVLGDKYLWYLKEVRKIKLQTDTPLNEVVYLDEANIKKSAEAKVLDKLNLNKMCCRRHMLTHVDIE
tara:strand:+ start:336 stop:569 length:234 start_codon:yes stop_codon:yes gene_type:complete